MTFEAFAVGRQQGDFVGVGSQGDVIPQKIAHTPPFSEHALFNEMF